MTSFITSRLAGIVGQRGLATSRFLNTSGSIRNYSTGVSNLSKLRNIGISAHIDSGKTTLTERILYYTGRIKEIHEVRGKDGVGAKMDSMDLEREKGITIQSAATYCKWGENHINIIDTPGHVDFTIEVERALRVLDGAVLVMCGVSGVQSQTITVDRQMRRYNVPRVVMINKLDRVGANPWNVINQLRKKLNLNAAAVQIPIGLENNLEGVCDLVKDKAYLFGEKGSAVDVQEIPSALEAQFKEKKIELIETVANVDDQLGEWMIENDFPNQLPEPAILEAAIRRACIARTFVPVFMGSAFKNTGVQPLLDGVISYLPSPPERKTIAIDTSNKDKEVEVELVQDPKKPFVGLAFKLEEGRFGQLTYMRVYQGTLKRGDMIKNVNLGKTIKVPRLVRMHSAEMEEVQEVGPGEICAMFGVDCFSGNTFTAQNLNYTMTSMHVPEPVMSLSIQPKGKDGQNNFSKALSKFQKEDPTFRVKTDMESGQIIISGMGELHLEIYIERIKREYGVECTVGKPLVAYRETIQAKGDYNYTHKKQSGGQGQYAKMIGYIEPIEGMENEFINDVIGTSIPPNYTEAIRKGFKECTDKGPLIGHPICGIRFVVNDGATHSVDSSELAFKIATAGAFREGFADASPMILEPIMKVEISIPSEFQGTVISGVNRRKGAIVNTSSVGESLTLECEVPLNNMFGYSTELRSMTQGKGEFTMEYLKHTPVSRELFNQLIEEHEKKLAEERK
ncbi:hypothetical protein CYY_000473 [Polysphondylium violaceum]|uniref:Elongation factor G, mitochondrial n=1 Tax=Polysphondylium violaceum TaxID=133409 RepID=A0A8J4PZN4_9MYCE|nr:hypothetical protein CYY_000473 [Polysphondylium violaceum]